MAREREREKEKLTFTIPPVSARINPSLQRPKKFQADPKMKREGRPYGTVLTFTVLPFPLYPRPAAGILNKLGAPRVSGIFAKVPAKPTHHSKFTGKCKRVDCSNCQTHNPVGKSKNKSKGTQKGRSSDAALNYKLITWRVTSDPHPGSSKLPVGRGCSASRILNELAAQDQFDHDDDVDGDLNDYCRDGYDVDNYDVVEHVDGDDHDVIDDDYDEIIDEERMNLSRVH